LHDNEFGPRVKEWPQGLDHHRDMAVRIDLARAIEAHFPRVVEPVVSEFDLRMLSGQNYARRQAPFDQGVEHRRELDCFRPGSDDQPNVCERQPSP
jgi:hypothetical protein